MNFLKRIFAKAPERPAHTADYQAVRAKRELEKRLREDGYSRRQAQIIVSESFGCKDVQPALGLCGATGAAQSLAERGDPARATDVRWDAAITKETRTF